MWENENIKEIKNFSFEKCSNLHKYTIYISIKWAIENNFSAFLIYFRDPRTPYIALIGTQK